VCCTLLTFALFPPPVQQTLELDFRKATWAQVSARMQMVCRTEGLAINDATLQTLVAGAQGDIRLVLGQLQVCVAVCSDHHSHDIVCCEPNASTSCLHRRCMAPPI
jgi:hypothetical protein